MMKYIILIINLTIIYSNITQVTSEKELFMLNRQINNFKNIINNKYIIYPNIKNISNYIQTYFINTCIINFNTSEASNSCIIKKTRYNKGSCSYVLKCNHLDQNYYKYNQRIKIIGISLNNIKNLKYCNGSITTYCGFCYDIDECKENNQQIINKCDYRSYYTCIKKDSIYIPKIHYYHNKHFSSVRP